MAKELPATRRMTEADWQAWFQARTPSDGRSVDGPITDEQRREWSLSKALPWFNEQDREQADAAALEADPGFVTSALSMFGDVGRGVVHGAARGVDEAVQLLGEVGFAAGVVKKMGRGPQGQPVPTATDEPVGQVEAVQREVAKVVERPDTMAGEVTAAIAQFVAAYSSAGAGAVKVGVKGLQAGAKALGKEAGEEAAEEAADETAKEAVAKGLVAGAVADAVGFDPHEARLSTLLNEVPWLDPVVSDWMASTNPDDPAWEGRLKNALEGTAIGMPIELVAMAVRRAVAKRNAGAPERADHSADSVALKDKAQHAAAVGVVEIDAAMRAQRAAPVDTAELTEIAPLPEGAISTAAFVERLQAPEPRRAEDFAGVADIEAAVTPEYARTRALASALGVAAEPEVSAKARAVQERIEEARAVPKSEPRRQRVLDAQAEYGQAVGRLAKGRDGEVAIEDVERLAVQGAVPEPEPMYSRHSAGVERTRYATLRTRTVDEVEAGAAPDFADPDKLRSLADSPEEAIRMEKADRAVRAGRVSMSPGVHIDESYRAGSTWSDARQLRPVDVYFEDVDGLADLDGLTAAVEEATRGASKTGTAEQAVASLRSLLADATPWRREQIITLRPDLAVSPEKASAVLDTVHAMGNTLHELAKRAIRKGATPSERLAVARAMKKLDAYLRRVEGKDGLAKQSLDEARVPEVALLDRAALKQWEYKQLEDAGPLWTDALAESLARTSRLDQVVKIATEARADQLGRMHRALEAGGRYITRPLREIWLNSVLSSPATHFRNVVGNGLVPLLQLPEHYFAGRAIGGHRQGMVEAQAALQGLVAGMRDAFFLAKQDFRLSMAAMADATDRVEAINRDVRARGWGQQHAEFIRQIKIDDLTNMKATGLPGIDTFHGRDLVPPRAARVLDVGVRKAVNTPLAALQAEDVFFKALTYRMEAQRLAARSAMELGLKGDDLAAYVADAVRHPPKDVHMQAMQQSHVNTFTNDLGQLGQASLDVLNAIPGARYVVPFFKTPLNIVRMAGTYAPFVERYPLIGRAYRAELQAIRQGGEAAARVQARRWMGATVLGLAVPMATAGIITGGHTPNKQFRYTSSRLGRPQYSIKVGDAWVDYRRWSGPIGLVLSGAADLAMLADAIRTDEELDDFKAIVATFGGIVGGTIDETWVGSLGEFFDIFAGQSSTRDAERFINSLARGVMPHSALGDDVRQLIDQLRGGAVRRDVTERGAFGGKDEDAWEWAGEALRTALRQAKTSWSIIGEEAAKYPRLDLYGEPLAAYAGGIKGINSWMAAISPVAFVQERTDPLSMELARLEIPVSETPRTLMVNGPEGHARTLEYGRDEYQFFARRAGQLFKQYGTKRVSLSRYRKASSDLVRTRMLEDMRARSLKQARNETLAKFPDLRRRQLETRMALRRELAGQFG